MCRCVWVWNMLSFHGKDSTLFLLTGRIKCFGTISKTQNTYSTDSKGENKEQLLLWASCGFVSTMTSSFRGYEQLCQSQYRRKEMSRPLDNCGVSRGAFRCCIKGFLHSVLVSPKWSTTLLVIGEYFPAELDINPCKPTECRWISAIACKTVSPTTRLESYIHTYSLFFNFAVLWDNKLITMWH